MDSTNIIVSNSFWIVYVGSSRVEILSGTTFYRTPNIKYDSTSYNNYKSNVGGGKKWRRS